MNDYAAFFYSAERADARAIMMTLDELSIKYNIIPCAQDVEPKLVPPGEVHGYEGIREIYLAILKGDFYILSTKSFPYPRPNEQLIRKVFDANDILDHVYNLMESNPCAAKKMIEMYRRIR